MVPDLIVVILTIVPVWVLYVFRTRGLREANEFLHEAQSEAMDRAITAERDAQAARTELAFLKNTVLTILQRPAVAIMSDQQISDVTNTLSAVVQAVLKPNSLN